MVSTTTTALDHYLALPYRIELIPDEGGWFVRMPELPGCISQGDTEDDALEMIRDAQRGWIEERLERGLPIPAPHPAPTHRFTGKFNVRVPRDLHRALVTMAGEQGASLNLLVATALQDAVTRAAERHAAPSGAPKPRPARNSESPSEPGVNRHAGLRTLTSPRDSGKNGASVEVEDAAEQDPLGYRRAD